MAVETNKTKWTDSFAKSIGVTTNPTGGEGGSEQPTDKYDALEYTSYKDMLSSKIQASVAKEQAQKYVGNSLANAGFGGQGIAESTKAGIVGTYNKAIMGADETHQANLIDIERQRQEEGELKGEEKWQSAMTMLQQAQNIEDLDYIKNNFYEDMNDEQKKMFDYYYNSYKGSFTTNDPSGQSYDEFIKGLSEKAFNEDGSIKSENDYANYNYQVMKTAGYYVQGLSGGNSRDTDDIDITIGKNSRDTNIEYDCLAGKEVTDTRIKYALNSVEAGNGSLVLFRDKLYIKTGSIWRAVEIDHAYGGRTYEKMIADIKKYGAR